MFSRRGPGNWIISSKSYIPANVAIPAEVAGNHGNPAFVKIQLSRPRRRNLDVPKGMFMILGCVSLQKTTFPQKRWGSLNSMIFRKSRVFREMYAFHRKYRLGSDGHSKSSMFPEEHQRFRIGGGGSSSFKEELGIPENSGNRRDIVKITANPGNPQNPRNAQRSWNPQHSENSSKTSTSSKSSTS